jgi:hypothetical protein
LIPTSDIQFLAILLRKVRSGDQITSEEGLRLDQIAGVGHSDVPMPGIVTMPEGTTAEEFASATRSRGQI